MFSETGENFRKTATQYFQSPQYIQDNLICYDRPSPRLKLRQHDI